MQRKKLSAGRSVFAETCRQQGVDLLDILVAQDRSFNALARYVSPVPVAAVLANAGVDPSTPYDLVRSRIRVPPAFGEAVFPFIYAGKRTAAGAKDPPGDKSNNAANSMLMLGVLEELLGTVYFQVCPAPAGSQVPHWEGPLTTRTDTRLQDAVELWPSTPHSTAYKHALFASETWATFVAEGRAFLQLQAHPPGPAPPLHPPPAAMLPPATAMAEMFTAALRLVLPENLQRPTQPPAPAVGRAIAPARGPIRTTRTRPEYESWTMGEAHTVAEVTCQWYRLPTLCGWTVPAAVILAHIKLNDTHAHHAAGSTTLAQRIARACRLRPLSRNGASVAIRLVERQRPARSTGAAHWSCG